MKVLCIEDQETKFKAIRDALRGGFGAEVTWARAVSASLGLLAEPWDLLVLDMNFPAAGATGREVGRRETSGIRVLQVMSAQDSRVPVIIATAHDSFVESKDFKISGIDELDEVLRSAFPKLYRGAVRVDHTAEAWRDTFLRLVEGLGFERRY